MNICITGALGHIGSLFIRDHFLKSFKIVYCVDNLFTQRYCSLFNLPSGINYSFHQIDFYSDAMLKILKNSDYVIHLAAITSSEESMQNKKELQRVNIKGVEFIAHACAEYGCKLFFPSTTSIYGTKQKIIDENCSKDDIHPQSPYAESKLRGEEILKRISSEKKLQFIIFRLGTIFGFSPGMRFHTAVNRFIWQAVCGEKITVWKTAYEQYRPYCELRDGINAIKTMIQKNIFNNNIYNIVTLNTTVKGILDKIKHLVPEVKVQFIDSPFMNEWSYKVSNEKSIQHGIVYQGDLLQSIHETMCQLKNINAALKEL